MLEAHGLDVAYRRGPLVVEGLDAIFPDGSCTAVVGPSGAGKSTLLFALALLLEPTAGVVTLDGEPVSTLSEERRAAVRASRFGFIFQDAMLDGSRTILENVLEGRTFGRKRWDGFRDEAIDLLHRFGIDLDHGRRPGQISGGQAQRVGLCRALLGGPGVVFADEPTGNLDRDTSAVVEQALADTAAAGAVVIIVTHDLDLAARCDRIIEIRPLDRAVPIP